MVTSPRNSDALAQTSSLKRQGTLVDMCCRRHGKLKAKLGTAKPLSEETYIRIRSLGLQLLRGSSRRSPPGLNLRRGFCLLPTYSLSLTSFIYAPYSRFTLCNELGKYARVINVPHPGRYCNAHAGNVSAPKHSP